MLKSIEALPPGLYEMKIGEHQDDADKPFVRRRASSNASRGRQQAPEPPGARRREDLRGGDGGVPTSTSAPTSSSGARWCRRWATRRAQAVARLPSAAPAALGDLRPQPAGSWWLAPAAQAAKAQRHAARARPSGAPHRSGGVGADQRLARRGPGAARRLSRPPSSRSTATCSPLTLRRAAEAPGQRRSRQDPRELPSVQAGARAPPTAAAMPKRSPGCRPDGALATSRCRCRALQLAQEMLDDYREPAARPGAGRGARASSAAGDHGRDFEPERALETLPLLLREPPGPRAPGDAARVRARRPADAARAAFGRAAADAGAHPRRARRRPRARGRSAAGSGRRAAAPVATFSKSEADMTDTPILAAPDKAADPLPIVWDPNSRVGEMLKGKRGLVIGVANADSIAYGCAVKLRAFGADIALTYLNDKAKKYVEPLARADRRLAAAAAGRHAARADAGGVRAHPRGVGAARLRHPLDRLRAARGPARPRRRLLAGGLPAGDAGLLPFVPRDGALLPSRS